MYLSLELDGLVSGETKRDLCDIFPIEACFRQRKTYDEYYCSNIYIIVNIDNLKELLKLNYSIELTSDIIRIK